MSSILWFILALVVIAWLTGTFIFNLGSLIHLLIVVAVIILIYNLVTGRRTAL